MQNNAENIAAPLLKTPLHALHVSLGAKMVEFAGYDMPVQYPNGVLKEHLHTRSAAGLFDVSHMGQALMTAAGDPAKALEKIVPGDIQGLGAGKIRYTLLLNDQGGIIDDLMVTRIDANTLFLVVNAGCKEKDFAFISKKIGGEVLVTRLEDRALVALQGPKAEGVMRALEPKIAEMGFMTMIKTQVSGIDCYVSRSGYTGEDGYEISVPAGKAEAFAKLLLSNSAVLPIGLGARDSLRLEAGLCLYGHDLDETTNPVEANLKWVIQKTRRERADFPGAAKIMQQFTTHPTRLRVGIKPDGRAPVREGAELFTLDGVLAGSVTSGGFGPSCDHPVAMGYVDFAFSAPGTKLNALLRGTPRPVEVAALPFTPHNYKRT